MIPLGSAGFCIIEQLSFIVWKEYWIGILDAIFEVATTNAVILS